MSVCDHFHKPDPTSPSADHLDMHGKVPSVILERSILQLWLARIVCNVEKQERAWIDWREQHWICMWF